MTDIAATSRPHAVDIIAALRRRGIDPWPFLISVAILAAFALIAIIGPWLGLDPFQNHYDGRRLARNLLPSLQYPFGTNSYGQDVLVQTLLGTKRTLLVGAICGAAIMLVGGTIGVVAGYFGGIVDRILMRITDFFYAIPFLPFTLVFVHFFGAGLGSVCTAMSLVFWRTVARIIRAQVLSLRERPYVRAAETMGCGPIWIILFHIIPGIAGLALVNGIFAAASSIATEASLSFIGLMDSTSMSWGLMLNQAFATGAIRYSWWWVIPPGASLAIFLVALFLAARSLEGAVDSRLAP